MADPFTFLIVLSGAMFMGSYFAGSIPLLFNMSESKMRVVSIFGAGLLVGTALSVIIPEGVDSLYAAQFKSMAMSDKPHHHHDHSAGAINAPQEAKSILEGGNGGGQGTGGAGDSPRIIPKDAQLNEGIKKVDNRLKRDVDSIQARIASESHESEGHGHGHAEGGHSHSHGHIHSQIGYSLVGGFVMMLLVDQISSIASSRSDRSGRQRMGISATIGLVVHAAADGIALGSASSINRSDVQLIVFVAIMLHKAPASFGLVSFLLMESLDKRSIRKHLLVFSCAAPVGALFTYILLNSIGSESISASESSTGILMLFSAGTFLYVATVHVLPELANHSKSANNYDLLVMDAQSPASVGHSHAHGTASFTMKELFYIIAGALVPAVLASGHSH